MRKAPAFQFYPSDFFGDPIVRIMSPESRAFYSLLLLNIWEYDTQFSLPDDDLLISKLLQLDLQKWTAMRGEIILAFECKNGRIISKRLQEEKKKSDKYRKLQSEKGKKGGKPRLSPGLTPAKPVNSLPTPTPTPTPIPIPIPKEKDKNKEKREKTSASFMKPTLEEVIAYCVERKNNINPNVWIDHYIGNGWMVGKTKMQNWKAVIRTWEARDNGSQGSSSDIGKVQTGEKDNIRASGKYDGLEEIWVTDPETGNCIPEKDLIRKSD